MSPSGWLRAAVLGVNDGIVSTASLVVGVAGAMSMATGEYVSVSSQSDTEAAALREARQEIEIDLDSERRELPANYVRRGLDVPLARRVARPLLARDELGISEATTARLRQAVMASWPGPVARRLHGASCRCFSGTRWP